MSRKKNVFDWNHISDKLTEDQRSELKALYKNYHRLFKCYELKYKRLKRLKMSLEMSSLSLTIVGSVVGAVTLNPIVIACVAGPWCFYLRLFNKIRFIQQG